MFQFRIFVMLLQQAFRSSWLNLILLPAALICAVLSIVRRKMEIGGWLFYFYFWISAFALSLAKELFRSLGIFAPSYHPEAVNHWPLWLR